MKKIMCFVVALVSCVLFFSSCENKGSRVSHELDGYVYMDESGWETFEFKDGGKVTWTYDVPDIIKSVQTWDYKVEGSTLYIGGALYLMDKIEGNPGFIGTISADYNRIDLKSGVGPAYPIFRVR